MQSVSTAVSHQTPQGHSSAADFDTLIQHGTDLVNNRVSDCLALPHAEVRDHRALDPSEGMSENRERVSSIVSGHSSPSVDCVNQYECVMATSPRSRPLEVGFKAIASSSPPRVSLESFPNEVLTHILSHLPPHSLSTITLVSRRFHSLVTTPHAWRIAFSRYFPGPDSLESGNRQAVTDRSDVLVSERRHFSRLTALASWRSEYILRTRLLRSLSRGKPAQFQPSKKSGAVRSASVRNGSAVTTYSSQLLYPVSHIDGTFGTGVDKREPLFVHGASEQGISSASDPSAVKVGSWGLSDYQMFRHFADLFPGDAEYGLGSGNMVGHTNCMDVSQPFGTIYGEGCPQGRCYYLSSNEQRGRFLGLGDVSSQPKLGVPGVNLFTSSVCAVWIAKSAGVLKMTEGLVGMLSGSSSGVLTAYSLGPHPSYDRRFERGQVTAKWVLSPGVPIISIAVDDNFSRQRYAKRRIWAVVLNALGEVFYLNGIPRQPHELPAKISAQDLENFAWKTGRSVRWELVELSRRVARPDPFNSGSLDGSYSPRSSCDSLKLSEDQVAAETREIEKFLALKPKHFRNVCQSWNMRRDLRVDFAGDDQNGAGESVIVITRGTGVEERAGIRRYTRVAHVGDTAPVVAIPQPANSPVRASLFGGGSSTIECSPLVGSPAVLPSSRSSGVIDMKASTPSNTEWRITDFGFSGFRNVQVTCSALDMSTYALLAADEDPLLAMSGTSTFSSPMSSPMPHMKRSVNAEVPGHRARYLAAGTASGTVFVWDIRSPTAQNLDVINSAGPLRIIETESPQISCVALTSLYVVHGGNDGLVQAWDPLASSTRPIRTINSRFSSRARRRLVQAEASVQGVGNNYFAAGTICLDPDPTVLRGMVSLGTHLRYWSYSSSAADQYKSSKRRLRRLSRGSNSISGGQRFSSTGRGGLYEFIEDEKVELLRQAVAEKKEKLHLSSRFGTDLLGPDATEEQLMAYAQLLSEEAYTTDLAKRGGRVASSLASTSPSDINGGTDSSFALDGSSSSSSPFQDASDNELAPEIAEAIRLSLLDEPAPASPSAVFDASPTIPIKYAKSARAGKRGKDRPSSSSPVAAESSRQQELDDLEFAIQLSLAEQQSSEQDAASAREQFPPLTAMSGSGSVGKGKSRVE